MVLVSSPVAKCAYKQHRYRNKCIATGSICAWALSVGGVSPPLSGTENFTFPDIESKYHQSYFEALDLITQGIESRFDQEGYKVYCRLENLLLRAIKKEDLSAELDFVTKFNCDDFHREMFRMQLHILAANFPPDESIDIHSIIKILKHIPASQNELMSEVCSLVSHISVMPATNAVS